MFPLQSHSMIINCHDDIMPESKQEVIRLVATSEVHAGPQ